MGTCTLKADALRYRFVFAPQAESGVLEEVGSSGCSLNREREAMRPGRFPSAAFGTPGIHDKHLNDPVKGRNAT